MAMVVRANEQPLPLRVEGIDRFVWNIEHGRFEQALSGLMAFAALITGLDIFLEHDKASFGNPWMWAPIPVTPVAAVAGVAGVVSKRMAKTFLPGASAIVVANGLQGLYLHVRGIARKPGGWCILRFVDSV